MKFRCLLAIVLMASIGLMACNPKPAAPGPAPPASAFTTASKAADDIAATVKLIRETETNLELQKLITAQEGLTVINYNEAARKADVNFVALIRTAKAANQVNLLLPGLRLLKDAINDLSQKGLLGIKNEKAKQTFLTVFNAITVALAIIDVIVGSQTATLWQNLRPPLIETQTPTPTARSKLWQGAFRDADFSPQGFVGPDRPEANGRSDRSDQRSHDWG